MENKTQNARNASNKSSNSTNKASNASNKASNKTSSSRDCNAKSSTEPATAARNTSMYSAISPDIIVQTFIKTILPIIRAPPGAHGIRFALQTGKSGE